MASKKIVIIGGGHNGLVAALYLADAGHRVTILESRDRVGGAAYTDTTTFPGFKFSKFSYLNSLMLKEIVEKFELTKYGYKVLPRNPSSHTPLPDGRGLILGPDMAKNVAEIARFSQKDAVAYPRYEHALGELGKWMSAMMTMTPPSGPLPRHWRDIKSLARLARHIVRLNPLQMWRLARLVLTDPVTYLDSWFESDVLKATLHTDEIIGATNLSGYVLLHHVMGDAGGARGVWGSMRGGMGAISDALAAACKERGVGIFRNTEVLRIDHDPIRNRVRRVVADMQVTPSYRAQLALEADVVVSAVNPSTTFDTFLADVHTPAIDRIRQKVARRDSSSGTFKINLALRGLPHLRGTLQGHVWPQHQTTIHISPTVQYILDALEAYRQGRSSPKPILEVTIPSVLDDTLAPVGQHVMGIFGQFVQYDVNGEEYWQQVVLPTLREYFTNIDEILVGKQVLTPRDIERELGMVGGNIFHGGMGIGQLFCNRPTASIADYRAPIQGVYLSGAGTHPGGGVCGASGRNAALEILADIRGGRI
ncbi:NAD(P)/FAD-dependent oxidoreductase [Candidatus Kaiserbacteria bacterium]|nr:NAD(P)/FAD-dependent oxidoreductase [Candidatus Kaiserbacteria bacterium]